MIRYAVTERDGVWAVEEVRPRLLATFVERDDAEAFRALKAGAPPAHAEASASAAPAPPAAPPPSAEPAAVEVDEWTDEELLEALALIERGAPLKSVADRFGKSWHQLRGVWAQHCREKRAEGK